MNSLDKGEHKIELNGFYFLNRKMFVGGIARETTEGSNNIYFHSL